MISLVTNKEVSRDLTTPTAISNTTMFDATKRTRISSTSQNEVTRDLATVKTEFSTTRTTVSNSLTQYTTQCLKTDEGKVFSNPRLIRAFPE